MHSAAQSAELRWRVNLPLSRSHMINHGSSPYTKYVSTSVTRWSRSQSVGTVQCVNWALSASFLFSPSPELGVDVRACLGHRIVSKPRLNSGRCNAAEDNCRDGSLCIPSSDLSLFSSLSAQDARNHIKPLNFVALSIQSPLHMQAQWWGNL